MALIHRVSRLFKADFHAVLDQIEEPELLLRQAIRDMEDELAATERGIANCRHETEQLSARQDQIQSAISNIDGELDLCFESGKPDLAKSLIRKKLEAEKILRRLSQKAESNQAFLTEQARSAEEHRNTLESLRQKAEIFSRHAPPSNGDVDDGAWLARDLAVGDDEVEIAFLREQSARSAS